MQKLARQEAMALLVAGAVLLAASGIAPKDRLTWFLEVVPIFIAVPLLLATARSFPFTPLTYRFILLHAIVLMVGGHYTYAEVPLGYWMQQAFDLARNDYDRIGHFFQGFVPALVVRELLLRSAGLRRGGWLFALVTATCLAISACYEFVEWWTAVAEGSAADAFLGTQGDVWDTQADMFMALVGAVCSQLALARVQDRQLGSAA